VQTQPEAMLVELIRYNTWANEQLLAICLLQGDALLAAPIPGAYGSIHKTIGHMLQAEAGYFGRITGQRLQPATPWEQGPGLAELAAFAPQIGAAFLNLAQRVPLTQRVHEEENGLWIDYQALQLYMQLINHGIAHRTDISTFLNQHGVALPELDNWGYMFAHPERFGLREGQTGEV
jgi:uncharacterized damage-inducible protein DinB